MSDNQDSNDENQDGAEGSKPSEGLGSVRGKIEKSSASKKPKPAKKKRDQALEPHESEVPAAAEEAGDSWALEADRMAIRMALIDCLEIMAGYYGRRTSTSALVAGLPIPPHIGITPALFVRAAERADLNAKLAERSLESLAIAPNLPCVLALAEGQACILWDIEYPDKHPPLKTEGQDIEIHPETRFLVQFPETSDEKEYLNLERLNALYSGYAFFVRPIARADERAGPAEIETAREWFWSAFRKHRTLYTEVVVAAIMINVFGIASSLFVMNVYDRVVPNNAFETLWALAIGIMIVYVFDLFLKTLRAKFLDHAGRNADIKISADLFEQILGMTMAARPSSAGILASKMREFETIRDFFTSATMVALIDLPFVFFYIAVIGLIGGLIFIVPLAAIPLVVGMGFFLQKPMQKVIKESLNESAMKNALLFETFTGLETIKMQAAEGHIQRRWEELSEKAAGTSVKMRHVASWAQYWTIFVQQMVSAWIVIAGVYLISDGSLTMGGLIACVILSGRAMAPLAQVAGLLSRFHQSMQSLEHLDELMKRPVERPKGTHFITMPHIQGKVEFRDVVFAYPSQTQPALNHINFNIMPGERVGVIGAVGSGKTTIERLLLNLYAPQSGSVQIDGTDVRQIDPGDLRRNIGAVQQSPQLFYGSVRENITMGHETAPDRAVLRAAELSGVMEFLRDSSAGLDTQVGERGEALSGGQRQSIAIARSLLYDPRILILDEPTASMDPASENRLRKRLTNICEGKTTILITHKGSMLYLVDKLILLDRGRLIAYGDKDEVISKLQARQYGTTAEQTDI